MRFRRVGVARPAVLAVCAALLGLAACTTGSLPKQAVPPPPPGRDDNRPNIVFVLTDDLTTNLVPYMPHVRALLEAGASFRNYYVVDSLCCPSRAAIFTGLYPHDDGVYTNGGPDKNRRDGGYHAYNRFGNPAKSFAVGLRASGYRTGFMGKYLNGYPADDPPPPGWDEWDATSNAYAEYDYKLNENGSVVEFGHDPQDYFTSVLSGTAQRFVRTSAASGGPFALEVATFTPHVPSTPAPIDRFTFPTVKAPRGPAFDRQPSNAPTWLAQLPPLTPGDTAQIDRQFNKRVAAVQSIDRMIGRLEQTLAAVGELDNTYFVFSSDNGYHLGEYRMRPGKQTAFDTDIRVPLVVAGPGIPAGTTVNSMTSSIDLAPTFLQMAGAKPTAMQDGVSLLSLARGQPAPPDWQRAVLVEHHGPVTSKSDPDEQPFEAGEPPSYEAMRTASFIYVEYRTGEREYYDLVHDPNELHNIAGSLSKSRLALLHTQLRTLATCHGAAACQRAAALTRT
ncbi:MAG TPA: sulfatase [Jatrophihabitans sp.]|jgi:arylsulfatase A-like enzyme|nr:sulfatase [Jatrophihabitans sp.]